MLRTSSSSSCDDLETCRLSRDKSIAGGLWKSAEFWAQSCFAISDSPDDAYSLLFGWFSSGQYARLHAFVMHNELAGDLKIGLLAIRSLIRLDNLSEAWALASTIDSSQSSTTAGDLALLECVKGDILLRQSDIQSAKAHYRKSLLLDFACTESLLALMESCHSSAEEVENIYAEFLHIHKADRQRVQEASMAMSQYQRHLFKCSEETSHVTLHHAQSMYDSMDYRKCLQLCRKLFKHDPYDTAIIPLFIECLYHCHEKVELFELAHILVDILGKHHLSMYAVGCYYLAIDRIQDARLHFRQSTSLNQSFANGWVAYGLTFFHDQENEQAMAAFTTARRLALGKSQIPSLLTGMLYVSMKQYELGQLALQPCVNQLHGSHIAYNEIGVIHVRENRHELAASCFKQAIDVVVKLNMDDSEMETIFSNWGRALLHMGRMTEARNAYEKAHAICPSNVDNQMNLATICYITGQHQQAIERLHQVLAIHRDDIFATTLLNETLQLSLGI